MLLIVTTPLFGRHQFSWFYLISNLIKKVKPMLTLSLASVENVESLKREKIIRRHTL